MPLRLGGGPGEGGGMGGSLAIRRVGWDIALSELRFLKRPVLVVAPVTGMAVASTEPTGGRQPKGTSIYELR